MVRQMFQPVGEGNVISIHTFFCTLKHCEEGHLILDLARFLKDLDGKLRSNEFVLKGEHLSIGSMSYQMPNVTT